MVRIKVDQSACQGHARCYAADPELFPLDDDGYSAIEELAVVPELEDAARAGVVNCPEHAITVIS